MSEYVATVKAKIETITERRVESWDPKTRANVGAVDRTMHLNIVRSEQPLLSTAPYGSMNISFRKLKNGTHPLELYGVGDVLEFDIRKSD